MMDASVGSEPMATPCETPTRKVKTKLINLALQGAARTAPSPGVSSTACSTTTASGSTASARRAPAQ